MHERIEGKNGNDLKVKEKTGYINSSRSIHTTYGANSPCVSIRIAMIPPPLVPSML